MADEARDAGMADIWKRLTERQAPLGTCPEGWCYDQLLGAALALKKACEVGPAPPDAQDLYRKDVLAVRDEGPPAFPAFAWDFYLNSAMHRVVWASERLLRRITNMQGREKWDQILEEACKIRKKSQGRDALEKVLKHFSQNTKAPVTQDNVLHILRARVNRQKHWWSQSACPPPEIPFCFVMHALKLVIDLYLEEIHCP